ncbi:hypothetical protein EW026_g4088 [Hermanssonia centrifuga]|uniref:Flavin-containing monooxygenase n=1 Tax=Hermanssonia centrifuga TaxID=98765 RepID=A0A4S4KI89_9APHY|nr:hypothetical protein EW026_g4088 [Hermanssonia centrifuga]
MIILLFKPRPPRTAKQPTKPRGRIAVVGAGLTGISSAAHAISHGFDVVIYEQSDKVGGIWANVNATSGLQLNSLLYRFHPAVCWSRAFPQRDEILKGSWDSLYLYRFVYEFCNVHVEITRIWREYKLEPRTRLSTQVTSVRRAKPEELKSVTEEELKPEKLGHARWIINDGQDGVFDAVIATVGTCGQPNMITLKGMPGWKEEQAKKQQDEEKRKDLAHEQEKEKKEKGGSHGERHGKRNPTAWTDMQKQNPDAVAEDQQEKKENNFLTPGEAYHGDGGDTVSVSSDEIATQDDGVWTKTKPQENAWDVGRDQVQKKEQGFPTPGEAFETGEDVQRGGEDKSLAEGKNEDNNDDANDTATKQQNGKAHVDEGDDVFKGPILHSSQLDRKDAPSFEGKTVAIIGGGASAVEAVEAALAQGAQKCLVIAREDKWIIPRNIFVDTLIAMQPFGREMPLSFLWEKFIIKFNYHGVEDLAPAHLGLFESTPVVNDEFLGHVRHGRCKYIRGDTEELTSRGVLVNVRDRNSRSGDKGNKKEFGADIIVLATGFKKPDVNFIEKDLFPEAYEAILYSLRKCIEFLIDCIHTATESVPADFFYRGLVDIDDQFGLPECDRDCVSATHDDDASAG